MTNRKPSLTLAAVASLTMLAPVSMAQDIDVGVTAAVNPDATGQSARRGNRTLVAGNDIAFGERITTAGAGQTQILFVDQSALTVGPNSSMVIDEFVYDPNTSTGKLAASVTAGTFRFVGGRISKKEAVVFRTPTATIGIRGGVATASVTPGTGATTVILHFGQVEVTNSSGVVRRLTGAGFKVETTAANAPPSPPARASTAEIGGQLDQFQGRPSGSGGDRTGGGARERPTNERVAASPVAALGSARNPQEVPPPVASGPGPAPLPNRGPLDGPRQAEETRPRPPVPLPSPAKEAAASPAPIEETLRFGTGRIGQEPLDATRFMTGDYTNVLYGAITGAGRKGLLEPRESRLGSALVIRGGNRLTTTTARGEAVSLPIQAGRFSVHGADTVTPDGPMSGTGYFSLDRKFLAYGLTADNNPNQRVAFFGGAATPNGGRVASHSTVDRYTLLPDPFLNSPIPFTAPQYGGSIPGASVSPLMLARPEGGTLGDGAGGNAALLQASLAIHGQGANQSSILIGTTGAISRDSSTNNNRIAQDGSGSMRLSATARAQSIDFKLGSVPDGDGNHFFGGNLDHFVLNQGHNGSDTTANPLRAAVVAGPGQSPVPYGFTQVATRNTASSTVGQVRTSRTLNGYAAGIADSRMADTTENSYVVANRTVLPTDVTITTDAQRNTVAARFDLDTVNFDGSSPGTTNATFGFGGSGGSSARGAFIDDRRFGASQSEETALRTNYDGLYGRTGMNTTTGARSFMVSAGTVPTAGFLPSGVSLCDCQYLSWGWWNADFQFADSGVNAGRRDRIHLATWVAGELPREIDMPTTGTASYIGHAIGSVRNGTASYVAAGRMTADYNFGTRQGLLKIDNFDGRNLSTQVNAASPSAVSFQGTGSNPTGVLHVNGSFFKGGSDPVAAIAGQFNVKDGSTYRATGTFAGQKP